MSRLADEIVARCEGDFPPTHKDAWTKHTTSEAKAEDEYLYLVGVIGKLYEKIDGMENGAWERGEQ